MTETMLPKEKKDPSAKTVLSTVSSAATTAVLIRSLAEDLIPYKIQNFLRQKIFLLFSPISSQITITVDEVEGIYENKLFEAVEVYIRSKITPSTLLVKAAIPAKETEAVLSMDNQELLDVFNGVQLKWTKDIKQRPRIFRRYDAGMGISSVNRRKNVSSHFEVSFHKKYQEMVMNSYFPYIVSEALQLKQQKKTLKIHTLEYNEVQLHLGNMWASVNLNHPATFDTLTMDVDMKKTIMADLDMFVRRKDFYRKVGKAWKRGYLLYGPPGTGKSSLIVSMAKYLRFDIYDLELNSVTSNSDLRKLIMRTANRSILVLEDIDCSIDLARKTKERNQRSFPRRRRGEKEISLSGFLNFIDGLWSSCGDERIIIFTTNHKERLDPALLRPGRMDVHIHMSYCTPCGFKMLASNYLGIKDHPLFEQVEQQITAAIVTPAEVAEQLMKTEDTEAALKGFLEFLVAKKVENELKANNSEAEE